VVYGKWLENFEGKSWIGAAGRGPGSVLIGGAFKLVGSRLASRFSCLAKLRGLASVKNRAKMPNLSLRIGNKL